MNIDSIVKILEKMLENPTDYRLLFELNSSIEEMLHEVFGEEIVPIDLNILGKKLGVDIEYELDMSETISPTKFKQGFYLVTTNPMINQKSYNIAINSMSSRQANRYTLAYCLGHYLLKSKYGTCYEFTPVIDNVTEIVVENFALTLLLPLNECFRLFDEFIEGRELSCDAKEVLHFTMTEWIEFLSYSSSLSSHYASIRFQQIRQLCGLAELIGDSQLIKTKKKYMELFN